MPGSEEQARLLEDALGVVRQQTATMRRCLETPGKLMDALKCWYVLEVLECSLANGLTHATGSQFHTGIRASHEQHKSQAILRTIHGRF